MTQQPPPPPGPGPYDPRQQGQHNPQGYAAPPGPGRADGEERTMMLLAHLSAPIAFFVSAGWVPFLGPLLIWLFYKDRSQAVRIASAGAFNFNITVTIATWVTWASIILTLGIGFLWGIPILIFLFVLQVWAHVRGVIKASNGETYDYPFQIRILS